MEVLIEWNEKLCSGRPVRSVCNIKSQNFYHNSSAHYSIVDWFVEGMLNYLFIVLNIWFCILSFPSQP